MQPINLTMIYYRNKRDGGHLEYVRKKCILLGIKSMLLFFNYYICIQDMQTFFFVSCLSNKSL